MIEAFLHWWLRQLRDLAAELLARLRESPAKSLTIEVENGAESPPAVAVSRRGAPFGRFVLDQAGITALGTLLRRHKRPSITLFVPQSLLLERPVVLPLASERDPERVLRYEMDRLTPFDANELYWTWHLTRRDRAQGRLHLRLSLIPKAALAPLLAALARAGAVPATLRAEGADGAPQIIDLRPAGAAPGPGQRRAITAAAACCAVLAVAVIALPFIRQSITGAAIERRIADLQPQVTQAEQLRRRIAGQAADTDVVAAQRAHTGDALQVLAEVTDVLADTYLTDFSMREGRLELGGRSIAAARLIAALSAGPAVHNPAFAAPVTRAESGDADVFSIRADITH